MTWRALSLHVLCVVLVNRMRGFLLIHRPQPSAHLWSYRGIWICHCTLRMLREATKGAHVAIECAECDSRTDRWQGWPKKSFQSVPRSECEATRSNFKNLRNECIWAICHHHRRRYEARRRVVASWLVASQRHRMKVARQEWHSR